MANTEATKLVGGGMSALGGSLIRGCYPQVPNDGSTTDLISGRLRSRSVTIPTASVLTLNSVGYELVPAPGSGFVLQFLGLILILDFNTTGYASGGAVAVNCNSVIISGTIAAAFINGTADAVKQMAPISDVVLAANTALVLKAATGDFTTGNSPLRVEIFYAVHPTGL